MHKEAGLKLVRFMDVVVSVFLVQNGIDVVELNYITLQRCGGRVVVATKNIGKQLRSVVAVR